MRDEMIKQLPDSVEPFIFPPISVSPQDFVSNSLIEAILGCDGVIYLEGGYSAKSFWVAFERDYALRAKKTVFRYDAQTMIFSKHGFPPLDLLIIYTYTKHDETKFNFIWQYMSQQRYFATPWIDIKPEVEGVSWWQSVTDNFKNSLNKGAFFVSFWSKATSEFQFKEFEYVASLGFSDRNVLALLEDIELERGFSNHPAHLKVPLWADKNLSHENKIDDLIVRLYWLIFRNQFPELAYD
ncbi:MAG: hypothetical protein H6672_14560 [Anaerolineaceae bacterium]|nr:hypothetical protein [Anaerolineaceae bacterium]